MLKIQTNGTISPVQALEEAVRGLIVVLSTLKVGFNGEVMKAKAREADDEEMGYQDT